MKIYPKKILNHQKMRKKIFFSYNNVIEAFLEKEKKLKMKDFLIFPGKKEVKFSDKIDDLKFTTFIQENCPEALSLKQNIISKIEKIISSDTVGIPLSP